MEKERSNVENEIFEDMENEVVEDEIKAFQINEDFRNILEEAIFQNAEEKLAKKQLALKIKEIIKRKNITKTRAVEVFKMNSLKVSALYRGKLFGFPLSRMIRFLIMLEHDVDIIIKAKSLSSERCGHLKVVDDTVGKV